MSRKWIIHQQRFQADEICPKMPVWPWAGHRNFAYDLVRWLRPTRIAELGVHWGTSFFAFAQAIKDGQIDCELIGVDTFLGDPHAGEYGEEVLETVHRITQTYFANQRVVIHRSLFRDALDKVEDDSCNIIHIDGFHTFEAVQDDFTTWLPKLAPDGIMLFHDTSPESGYGSAEFWKMLAARYPNFAFPHSWGLGVLFPKGTAVLDQLRARGLNDKRMIYEYRAEAELSRIKIEDLSRLSIERFQAIEQQAANISAQKNRIEQLNRDLQAAASLAQERFGIIQTEAKRHEEAVTNLKARIQELDAQSQRLSEQLQAAQTMARERYEVIQSQAARVHQQSERIARLARELDDARQVVHDSQQRITSLSARVTLLEQQTARLERALLESESTIDRKQAIIEGLEHHLKERDAMLEELRKQLASLQLDVDLLNVRTSHAESVLATHRREIAALLETRAGKAAAARLASEQTTTVLLEVENGAPHPGVP